MSGSIALLLQVVGAVFVLAASLGLLRFSDPLQRMHASTKAGTVGAGFVLLGVMVERGGTETLLIGAATLVFLILTIPIAGHLLGRAAYVSGTPLSLPDDRDALAGVLPRGVRTEDEAETAVEKTAV